MLVIWIELTDPAVWKGCIVVAHGRWCRVRESVGGFSCQERIMLISRHYARQGTLRSLPQPLQDADVICHLH